jgi:hypothetical protein
MRDPRGQNGRLFPRHWIGVEKGWRDAAETPWDRLVSLPPDRLKTHVLVIGSTGSGKTVFLTHLFAQDIVLKRSFVVLDLRGDLVDAVLALLAGRIDPRKVLLLDLREKRSPAGFDPLAGRGEAYFRALAVIDAIAAQHDLGVQVVETLRNALLLLAEAGLPLTLIERLFHDGGFRDGLVGRCRSEQVAGFWARYGAMSPDRQATLAMPVMNKVSLLLATEGLRKVLGHPKPVDLGRHLDSPGSVTLVSLAGDELHGAGRMFGRIFLASACREIFSRVGVAESGRNPVRLYVDEFENFAGEDFEPVLAEGRRFKFSLVLAHQTLAQLSPRMRSMVLNNVGTKVVFRCGREDSAALSRDVSGDPRAHDFTTLGVGEALVWSRGVGEKLVEVNAPLLKDTGARNPAARRLARVATRLRAAPPERQAAEPAAEAPPRREAEAKGPKRPRTDLEDWLS